MIEQICVTETLLEAAKEVFETMIFMNIEKAPDQQAKMEGTMFLGTITFKGGIEGCLSIALEEACGIAVAKNMLCMESDDEMGDEDLADAIGEVANMVMGSVKTRLQDEVPDIEISIPTVICGRVLKNNMGDCSIKAILRAKIDEYDAELCFLCRSKR